MIYFGNKSLITQALWHKNITGLVLILYQLALFLEPADVMAKQYTINKTSLSCKKVLSRLKSSSILL